MRIGRRIIPEEWTEEQPDLPRSTQFARGPGRRAGQAENEAGQRWGELGNDEGAAGAKEGEPTTMWESNGGTIAPAS
jgi:hypothetical protein